MLTYLLIGLAIQLLIVVERVVRLPGILNGYTHLWFWLGFLVTVLVNIVLWPIAILAEVRNIYNHQ